MHFELRLTLYFLKSMVIGLNVAQTDNKGRISECKHVHWFSNFFDVSV